MRLRIASIIAAVLLPLGGLTLAMASPAFANGSGDQFCGISQSTWFCLNAWGGGPWVRTYTGGPYTSNNDFTPYRTPQGHTEFEFTGGGGDTGLCIADANNDPNRADAYLVECPTSGAGGWGTQMNWGYGLGCVSGAIWIYDYHWGGYVDTISGFYNGAPFYLNNAQPNCYYVYVAS